VAAMKRAQRRHWLSRTLLAFFIGGAALGVFMYRDILSNELTAVLAASDEDPVPVCEVELEPVTVSIPADGEIVGLQSAPLQTPRTRSGGLTLAWLAPEGSKVAEGDPVVRFDSTDANLNIEKQQNLLAGIAQRLRILELDQETLAATLGLDIADAKDEYRYAMSVLPEDETIFSKWDIIEARIDAAFAKERIDVLNNRTRQQRLIDRADRQILLVEKGKAEAELAIARQTLAALELQAPAQGVVLYYRDRGREPQVGNQFWPGQTIVEVADLGRLQARIYVLERDGAGLELGKAVSVHLEAFPEEVFAGEIRSVAPLAQPLERNSPLRYFTCEVGIRGDWKDLRRLRPGMSVKADVILHRYDSGFVIPSSAIAARGSEKVVFVLQGTDFAARSVSVAPGPHGRVVVLGGVGQGDVIAMRNPFETRRLSLPDFGKVNAADSAAPVGGRRIRFH
jgi:HlyD family secretion protein